MASLARNSQHVSDIQLALRVIRVQLCERIAQDGSVESEDSGVDFGNFSDVC